MKHFLILDSVLDACVIGVFLLLPKYCVRGDKCTRRAAQSNQLRAELEMLRERYMQSNNEMANLRKALDEARTNSERLHKESELVVHNVSTWVREQK